MSIEELNVELSSKRKTQISPTGKWIAGITGKTSTQRILEHHY